ncbi:hypothetical protein [Enterococcus faecalis]|uniref:hypothetical protein n=1 Tax=Enterococcus faecalis TaxID=1351 RepID=UPI000665C9CD|nr:hypothetical protein [Enterococcus faecalis]EGO6585861.1 hypothetical protein [Enterococcus faecalis]EGO8254975.1 hypothetical protein [Enterococcus faecalis]EGS1176525.1 hypothetical protein [Enterococcus faecalis]EGS8255398.1 hypothetical protein [Enterococcus faecalis]EHU8854447.1 hypothetical protein [Enterococcus faecalis]
MENQVIEINVKKRLRYYLLEASVYFKIYVLRKEDTKVIQSAAKKIERNFDKYFKYSFSNI